ncbi:hypothetical protein BY458DRAFT_325969 [Sporodiniella umbellata]|nr:hypothetical protein BY458DRAFT_325969 [Sporodiniella umbellata]
MLYASMNILCFHQKKDRLGCAYHTSEDLKLRLMEDVRVSSDLGFIHSLILQLSPCCVLVPESFENPWVENSTP